MGVYTRYKRPGGFRALVELLESVSAAKREKMVELGITEDPVFTNKALAYILRFEDLLSLDDVDTAEVVARAPGRILGYALQGLTEEDQRRFLKNAKPKKYSEIRDALDMPIGPTEHSGARLRVVQAAREAERNGRLHIKKIPEGL